MSPIASREPSNAPHFRIVFPEEYRARKHVARTAQVFITLPGQEEVPLPATTKISADWPVDGPVQIDVSFIGTIEVQYR